jgi:hypothetical protein
MFIINPDQYLLPCYRISPFRTKDISYNNDLPYANKIDEFFKEKFKTSKYYYCNNGREALNVALSHFNLNAEDIITILTTSGNFYISGCVTNEIEKFCKWNRKIEAKTKVILINHEFGYPYEGLEDLKKHDIPIIEDCAHTFFSTDKKNVIGQVGDFVIYSFPKMFPIQIGGLLLSNNSLKLKKQSEMKKETLQYIKNVLSHYILNKDNIICARLINYKLLKSKLEMFGFSERFELTEGIVPGVFMFRVNDTAVDLVALKKYFYAHGIQCSVFYGENAFFIPCHQNLNEGDIEYFSTILKSFFKI